MIVTHEQHILSALTLGQSAISATQIFGRWNFAVSDLAKSQTSSEVRHLADTRFQGCDVMEGLHFWRSCVQ